MLTEKSNQSLSKKAPIMEKPRFMSQAKFEMMIEAQIVDLQRDVVLATKYKTMTAEEIKGMREEINEKRQYLEDTYKPDGLSALSNMKKMAGGMFARGKAIAQNIGAKAESIDWKSTENRVKALGAAVLISGLNLAGNPAFAKEGGKINHNPISGNPVERIQNDIDQVNSLAEATELNNEYEYEVGDMVSINGRNIRLVGDGNGKVDLVKAYKIASKAYYAPSVEIPVGPPKLSVVPSQNRGRVNSSVKPVSGLPKIGFIEKLGNFINPKAKEKKPSVANTTTSLDDLKNRINRNPNNQQDNRIDPYTRVTNPALKTDIGNYPPITPQETEAVLKAAGYPPTPVPPPFPINLPFQTIANPVDVSGFNFPPSIPPSLVTPAKIKMGGVNYTIPAKPVRVEVVTPRKAEVPAVTKPLPAVPPMTPIGGVYKPQDISKVGESIPAKVTVGGVNYNIKDIPPVKPVWDIPTPRVENSPTSIPNTNSNVIKPGRSAVPAPTPVIIDQSTIKKGSVNIPASVLYPEKLSPDETPKISTPEQVPASVQDPDVKPESVKEPIIDSGLKPIGSKDSLRESVLGSGYIPTAPGIVGQQKYGTNLGISRPKVSDEPVLDVGVAINTAGQIAGSVGVKTNDWGVFVRGNSADGGSGKVVVRKRF